MTKYNACPICGKKRFKEVEKGSSKVKKFTIVRCSSCGLVLQDPIPNKRDLREFYENIYGGKYDLKSTEEAFLNFDEKQEEGRIKAIERFKKKGKILDVGASSGFFLKKIKEHKNWIGYGIEYSENALKSVEKSSLNIKVGEITNVSFPDNYFDVITMHSVLEHISDLTRTVGAVGKKLKKGGLFVFNVPNVSSFEFALYKFLKKPFAGFIFEHIYYFTPESIRILLKNNNFEILFMTSRHYSRLAFPTIRPLIGIATFIPKLFLEYTDLGGKLLLGNIIYAYAKKIDSQPKEFWDNWADDFIKDPWQTKIHPQHKWLLRKINTLKPESILEVGCGFGRNIKFLIQNGLNPSLIVGVDISPNMISLARKYVGSKEVKFYISDLNGFIPKKKFDFVFTHGVLMHILDDNIENAIDRLIDLCKKHIVLIEQNYQADNNYTFVHDYRKLLSSKKIDIIEYQRNKRLGLDLIYAKVR